MLRLRMAVAFLALGVTASPLAKPFTLHVAPNGNDEWSGRPDKPARDGRDGPLATLPAALKAARAARRDTALSAEGITILVRGGSYLLSEALVVAPEDGGPDTNRLLTIAAYPDETPVISGGLRITGWNPVSGQPGLWQADVPAAREGRWGFHSLFADGRRLQRARTPNQGFFRIQGGSPQDRPVKLRFKPGEVRKEWAEAGDVEVVALLAWSDLRMQIRSVDETGSVAVLSGNPQPSNQERDAQYYIENAADALDVPGEWYLDRRKGVVFYRTPAGEDPNKREVIAPQLGELVTFQGDLAGRRPVQNVVLRGLTFAYTDWTLGEHGYADTQAACEIPGDVRAEGAVDCVVEGCRFAHLAGYALELGRGCQRWRVGANEMFDLGAGGVRIGEPAQRPDGVEANREHLVTDNHIHHLGQVYAPGIGVIIFQSGGNRIVHNHIHDLFYTAISVGWNWGYQETPCRENIIESNHLHDIGQFRLSDMGAVYTLGIQNGTVIRNNLIHDVNAFTYGGWGLYTDEGSTGIVLESNVVYRTKSAGFHQHYGRDNIVRNNIFAYGREHQLMRSRDEEHNSFTFERNIVLFDSGDLLGSTWSNDRFKMDRNLYFDTRPGASAESLRFGPATLSQWRGRGHDPLSVVADPQFIAPKEYDFRLKPTSPALALGFKPIDLSDVGVRKRYRAQVHDPD
jgi:hypothetical protein